jgi:hypothetical protein
MRKTQNATNEPTLVDHAIIAENVVPAHVMADSSPTAGLDKRAIEAKIPSVSLPQKVIRRSILNMGRYRKTR